MKQKQYHQNRLFKVNQKCLFKNIDRIERSDEKIPDPVETLSFWSEIWGKSVHHNESAELLKNLEEELANIEKQSNITIMRDMVRKQCRKTSNWKAPDPDGLQGYRLKKFTALTECVALQLDECLQNHSVP